MKFEDFSLLGHSRPMRVSLGEAQQVCRDIIDSIKNDQNRREYLNRRWQVLSSNLTNKDQLWIFETSGLASEKKRGIAREASGTVIDFLVL